MGNAFVPKLCRLRGPERAQVHGRIARLPAGEKALDRRVEDDLVEFFEREQTVPADRRIGRRDRLE